MSWLITTPFHLVWVDGACSREVGGWSFFIKYPGGGVFTKSGGDFPTTNNRMEMTAAIEALASFEDPSCITLHSDSKYVINGITKWVHRWRQNGWINSFEQPVANADLWEQLYLCTHYHHVVEWRWVKGHSGDVFNDLCDKNATEVCQQIQKELGM